MKAGIMRETITIQQPVTIQNEYGANGIVWKDITKQYGVWCWIYPGR